MTARHETEQAMARDLEHIDLIMAIGSQSARRHARRQRRAIHREIAAWNHEDGLGELTDDQLLAELTD